MNICCETAERIHKSWLLDSFLGVVQNQMWRLIVTAAYRSALRAGTHYPQVTWAHVMLRVQLGCERQFNIEFYDADSHFCHSAYVTWSDVELWSAHAPARLSHFCCRTHFVRRDQRVECSALDTLVLVCVCVSVSVCVCVCLCLYVCVCLCVPVFVCVCMCVSLCVCLCLYVCVWVCMYVCVCVCLCVCLSVCVCVCVCICVCVFMLECLYVYLCLRVCVCVCLVGSLALCWQLKVLCLAIVRCVWQRSVSDRLAYWHVHLQSKYSYHRFRLSVCVVWHSRYFGFLRRLLLVSRYV
jgi:hypothetical protein